MDFGLEWIYVNAMLMKLWCRIPAADGPTAGPLLLLLGCNLLCN